MSSSSVFSAGDSMESFGVDSVDGPSSNTASTFLFLIQFDIRAKTGFSVSKLIFSCHPGAN